MKKRILILSTLIAAGLLISATGADIYRNIYVTIPGEDFCTQKLGLAYHSGDLWLPVENGTIHLSQTENCTTDKKGYCNLTVERDKVYAVKHNNNTVKLFIGCQEVVIVIRI
jgi:hypothetical protein